MAAAAPAAVPAAAVPEVKHGAWMLTKFGVCSTQLQHLFSVAAKLETHVPHPVLHARPPPFTGTAEQEEALQQLTAQLVDSSCGGLSEGDLVWFLRESSFDVAAARRKLGTMLAWRQAHRLTGITASEVAAELATGKAYKHAHPDVAGRPVLVVRAHKHIHGQFKLDDTKRLFTYIVDAAIAEVNTAAAAAAAAAGYAQLPSNPAAAGAAAAAPAPDVARQQGAAPAAAAVATQQPQEQFVGIVDLRHFSLTHVDLLFGCFAIEAFQLLYPGRVALMLLVDAPRIFRAPWELLKPLVRKYASLVRFVSRQELAEYFTPDTLPPDFAAK